MRQKEAFTRLKLKMQMRFRSIAGITTFGDHFTLFYFVPNFNGDATRHQVGRYAVFLVMVFYRDIISPDVYAVTIYIDSVNKAVF